MAGSGRQNANDTLALALAAGEAVEVAARRANVSPRTAHRRQADPAFRRRVHELRGAMVARALGKMADGLSEAASVLRQLLGAASENVRLGAARSLLELGVKLREAAELEERLARVEQQLQEHEKHR